MTTMTMTMTTEVRNEKATARAEIGRWRDEDAISRRG